MAIARNLCALQATRDVFTLARNDAIRRISGGKSTVPDDLRDDFASEMADLARQETDVALARVIEADLNLAENRLPPTVLAALLPLVDA